MLPPVATMRAAVIDRFGGSDVLAVREVDRPNPGPGEVRVRIRASSINPVDCNIRRGELKRFMKLTLPHALGIDLCGEVDALGDGVTGFAVGDRVFGWLHLESCGAWAEYAIAKAEWLVAAPSVLDDVAAACLPGVSVTAVQGLRARAKIGKGQRVLVVGASGGVGHVAVQIARAMGAEVTAVCGTRNLEMVKRLGAAHVVDYTKEDVSRAGRYHAILDCVGQKTYWQWRPLLERGGHHVIVPASPRHMLNAMLSRLDPGAHSHFFFSSPNRDDLAFVRDLAEAGKLIPTISETLPLDRIARGNELSDTGRTVGKIAITMS